MEAVLAIGSLLAIGYFNSNNETKERELKEIPESQKPNGKNIYESNRVQENTIKELEKAKQMWEESKKEGSGVVIPYSTKKTRRNTYKTPQGFQQVDSGQYSLNGSDNFTLSNREEFSGTNKMADNITISKDVIEWETHNNMTPYFGANIKQNVSDYANETILGAQTGSDVTYKHKTEVESFAVLKKENVYGDMFKPDLDRYMVSDMQNGVKPFEEIKVPVGLNQGYNAKNGDSMVYGNDNYRPQYKTVDELRIKSNPRVVYKSRGGGALDQLNTARPMERAVVSRRYKDASFTNIAPTDGNVVEKSVMSKKYREPIGGGTYLRDKDLDKDKIVLRGTDRNNYGQTEEYKMGPHGNDATYNVGEHRDSFKKETSTPIGNVNGEEFGYYTYDPENWKTRTTKKETYVINQHYEKNIAGMDKMTHKVVDPTKTTIKEQTMLQDHVGSVGNSDNIKNRGRKDLDTVELNSIRVLTDKSRAPAKSGVRTNRGLEIYGDYKSKKLQYNTTSLEKRPGSHCDAILSKAKVGQITKQKAIYGDCKLNSDRIDEYSSAQFRNNPYKVPEYY